LKQHPNHKIKNERDIEELIIFNFYFGLLLLPMIEESRISFSIVI